MQDNQIKARFKAVLNGTTANTAASEHPMVVPGATLHPDHALQVLTRAERTAEDHVATARRQADKIRSDARAAADQAALDARTRTEDAQRTADRILTEAKAEAQSIVGDARGHAEQLRTQARQRYEDSVGGLISQREALQQQIESLEHFDREYRARLTAFMQGQLRSLWVDRPQVGGELPTPVTGRGAPGGEPVAQADPDPAGPAAQGADDSDAEPAGPEQSHDQD